MLNGNEELVVMFTVCVSCGPVIICKMGSMRSPVTCLRERKSIFVEKRKKIFWTIFAEKKNYQEAIKLQCRLNLYLHSITVVYTKHYMRFVTFSKLLPMTNCTKCTLVSRVICSCVPISWYCDCLCDEAWLCTDAWLMPQEQVEEMKKKEDRLEKQMAEVMAENKRLVEPLQKARDEVEELRRQLSNYEKDKQALAVSADIVRSSMTEQSWISVLLTFVYFVVSKQRYRKQL